MGLGRILEVLDERGLWIDLAPDGSPRVLGPLQEISPAILEAVKAYRKEIIAKLTRDGPKKNAVDFTKPVECRWANGTVGKHWFPEAGWPVGAREWRYVGDTQWAAIPEAERPVRPASGWTGAW